MHRTLTLPRRYLFTTHSSFWKLSKRLENEANVSNQILMLSKTTYRYYVDREEHSFPPALPQVLFMQGPPELATSGLQSVQKSTGPAPWPAAGPAPGPGDSPGRDSAVDSDVDVEAMR